MVIKSDWDMLETNGHLHSTRLDVLFQMSYSYFFRKKWPKIKYFDFSDLGVVGLPKASGNFASLKWVVVSLPKASGNFFFAKMGSKIPTKGQWKIFFTKMGSSFPSKGQWKIFFAKMGTKIPSKGQSKGLSTM